MPSRSQRVSPGKGRPKCFRVRPFFFCEGKTSRLSEKAVFILVEKSGNYESRNTRGKGAFTEQDVSPWTREYAQVSQIKLMPNVFAKRRERYRLRSRSKAPKSKVDACV